MAVELTASTELVDAIGQEQFAAHLALFGATITGQRLSFFGMETVYALEIPDAPASAATVTPTFHRHGSGDNATISVLSIDYRDAAGREIHPQPPGPGQFRALLAPLPDTWPQSVGPVTPEPTP